ncbi:MAG: helix-turn-helix transcriptional regulator, partial [Sulfitobacter sp.]|nr:helix-turn-helix transcriptional regulator [Sulfitobacter sp.]
PAVALTDRERDILAAVARGDTNAEIGQALHLSLSSVKAHIGNLMDKVGARNRVQIAIWAHQTGHTGH